ncbi:MAG: beta-ketoacyl-[acyl-carrier-protein] synthase family protein [Pseudomonadota bacterium]
MSVFLNALGIINALGATQTKVFEGLIAESIDNMLNETGLLLEGNALVGRVTTILPSIPPEMTCYKSRNNQLLLAAFEQIRPLFNEMVLRYGSKKIGIVLGTSTSGIDETEQAIHEQIHEGTLINDYHYARQEMGNPANFLAEYLNLSGIAYTISTACTSSAKAMIAAHRLISTDVCDVVIAGGVDSLCRLTLNGFQSLESISPFTCLPMSLNRRGINIGEGAALFLVSREPSNIKFSGYGESSDAYHISSPDPDGYGAEAAMRGALKMANCSAEQVGYINLHGTATIKNDEMESKAVARIFGLNTLVSSTKPLVGHTLGAAGATELAFLWLMFQQKDRVLLPPHYWDNVYDPALPPIRLVKRGECLPDNKRAALSNSFAFGGNNVSLLVEVVDG